MQCMKFIVLDTQRKSGLKLKQQNHIGLKAVPSFEPKSEQAGPGGLVPIFSIRFRRLNRMRTVRHLAFHWTSYFKACCRKAAGGAYFDLDEGVLIL